jgi:hypothetical protein
VSFSPTISEAHCQELMATAPAGPLLPHLTSFSPLRTDPILPYAERFLGPQVRELRLSIDTPKEILQQIKDRCPFLQHVDFTGIWYGGTKIDDNISAAICGWNQLHSLSVSGLNPRALLHIASLPELQRLTLRGVNVATLPENAFPALQNLLIRSVNLGTCIQFMECMSLHQLTAVVVEFNHATSSGWNDGFNLLLNRCIHSSLKKLGFYEHQSGESQLEVNTLRQLFIFSNLTALIINPHVSLNLDDSFIRDLALALPRLEHLELNSGARVTLQGLIPLAKSCPDLNTLTLAVDTWGASHYQSRPGEGIQNKSLQLWDADSSIPFDTIFIASFLSDVFPKLENIISSGTYEDDGSVAITRWQEVQDLIPMFVSIRAQERAYQAKELAALDICQCCKE